MKKLIVIANDLERSGNSTVTRAIAYHLAQQEVDSLLITSDENDLDETFPGEYWDLEDQIDSSELFAALEGHDAVIVDLHSGAARNWADFCSGESIDNLLAELDVEMTLVIPDTSTERCNEEIFDLTELFSDSSDYVIARMPVEDKGHVKWKGSEADKATRYLGATLISLPAFAEEFLMALENSEATVVTALNSPSALPRFAEVQAHQWLDSAADILSNANDFLVPDGVGETVLGY